MVFRSLHGAWMLVLVVVGLAALAPQAHAVAVGEPAPAFTLMDLDSQQHSLSGYGTHPVLLMFFSYDDATSISLAPLVQSTFYEGYATRGLIVLGIECKNGSAQQVETFSNDTGAQFPLLLDGDGTRTSYDVPTNSFVLVDGVGTVRYVALGPTSGSYDESAMKTAVEDALREANSTKASTWGLIKTLYK